MENSVEQRVCLEFCVLNEISCVEALKMVQKAYGNSSMSRTQAYEWYKSFKEGREVIENLNRSKRPSTTNTEENVAKIKKIVMEEHRMTEREIARDLNISNGSVHHILHDILGMRP
ncbi:protein GVQW3-like [Teleopsis dalmanni]|uniref:protein GVQW3-like n=1 Tax=Teleopsis dalmanni TaxID=139649 RepID=UPI0018CC876E|nr:protein GVQW3-like [Teleopsis dalmanni]